MSSAAETTFAVVRGHGVGDPELFFRTVVQAYDELPDPQDFDAFTAAFTQRAALEGFGVAGEDLVVRAEDGGRMDFVSQLVAVGETGLADEYARLLARSEETDTEETDTEVRAETDSDSDEDARWGVAVREYGPAWAAWDGSESGWDAYRDWFYDATNTDDPAMYAVAYHRLDPLNGVEPAERIARLREYGFTIDLDIDAGGEVAEADPAAAQEAAEQAVEQLVGSGELDPDLAAGLTAAFGEVLTEIPDAADFTEQDLLRLFAEVAREIHL